MIRYIQQKNSYSCVPIALINVGKWADLYYSYKEDYKYLKLATKCDLTGTLDCYLEKYLKNEFSNYLKITKIKNKSIERITKHLKDKGAVLMNYGCFNEKKNKDFWHTALFTDIKENKTTGVPDIIGHNIVEGEVTSSISLYEFFSYLQFKPKHNIVWLLKKNFKF